MTSPTLDARLAGYSPVVVSLFRIIVALLFTLHGSMTLFNWPLTIPFQVDVGDWPGWWAALIEFVTGLLVLVGLFTRPAAFVASGTMAVAYFWQHWLGVDGPKIFWPFDQQIGGNGGELAILFCFAFFLIFFIGPGSIAIDSRRQRRRVVTGTAATVGTATRPGLLSRFRRR
ncbi:MAG TPA: DoxX family protein [Mycobacterium sp.]|jgi:putative oxidoreductase